MRTSDEHGSADRDTARWQTGAEGLMACKRCGRASEASSQAGLLTGQRYLNRAVDSCVHSRSLCGGQRGDVLPDLAAPSGRMSYIGLSCQLRNIECHDRQMQDLCGVISMAKGSGAPASSPSPTACASRPARPSPRPPAGATSSCAWPSSAIVSSAPRVARELW